MAREMSAPKAGAYYPQVTAGFSASRQRTSAAIAPVTNANLLNFSLYTPECRVSYTPDVFGLNRRTIESLEAQAEATRFALLATQITLTSNVVAAAIQEATLRAQIAATTDLIAANTDMLRMLKGAVGQRLCQPPGCRARRNLRSRSWLRRLPPLGSSWPSSATCSPISRGISRQRRSPAVHACGSELPQELPVSLPSRLVEQRPDVRQAEENLHAASAQIGIASPTVCPTSRSLRISARWRSAPAGTFDPAERHLDSRRRPDATGVRRRHAASTGTRSAGRPYLQAAAQYRSTVLAAFQNVADTLHALETDADALKAAAAARQRGQDHAGPDEAPGAGRRTATISRSVHSGDRLPAGGDTLLQAQSNRYADTAALFQALGGGWWNRDARDVAMSDVQAKH